MREGGEGNGDLRKVEDDERWCVWFHTGIGGKNLIRGDVSGHTACVGSIDLMISRRRESHFPSLTLFRY